MSKLIVTFDKSNEDIPTLVVGNDAERIWNELNGQKVELKVTREADKGQQN